MSGVSRPTPMGRKLKQTAQLGRVAAVYTSSTVLTRLVETIRRRTCKNKHRPSVSTDGCARAENLKLANHSRQVKYLVPAQLG